MRTFVGLAGIGLMAAAVTLVAPATSNAQVVAGPVVTATPTPVIYRGHRAHFRHYRRYAHPHRRGWARPYHHHRYHHARQWHR